MQKEIYYDQKDRFYIMQLYMDLLVLTFACCAWTRRNNPQMNLWRQYIWKK